MKQLLTRIALITFLLATGFTGRLQEPKSESSFTVNTVADTNDSNLADMICADAQNNCSLRAAIQQVHFNNRDDNRITVPAGNYYLQSALPALTIPLLIEGAGASGINPTAVLTSAGVVSGLNIQSNSTIRGVKFFNFINGINVSAGSGVVEECIMNGNQIGINIIGGAQAIDFTIRRSTIKENIKGIWLSGDSASTALYLEDSLITLNENNGRGCGTGARVRGNSTLYAFNTTFSENINDANGGAICTENEGSVTLENSHVVSNSAGARGGGIYMDGSGRVRLINGTSISNNEAEDGGGIFNYAGELVAESPSDAIQISSNLATNAYGGIFINRSDNRYLNSLDNVIVRDNQAPQHGGITFENYGRFTISNSSITGNISYLRSNPTPLEGDGGGVYISCTECLTHIINTTISSNSSSKNGGGLAVKYGRVFLYNVTITANTADSDNLGTEKGSGGGIYNESGDVFLNNSLVANNQDLTIAGAVIQGYDIDGEITSEGYNLIGTCDWMCEMSGVTTGNIVGIFHTRINPRLGGLALDSSWNRFDQWIHPLLSGSPAINAGNPAGCSGVAAAPLLEDQVGGPRSQSGRCDIGAYESDLSPDEIRPIYLPMLLR